MNTTDYENIWKKSLIHVTDEFALPPVVLQAGEAIIGTLGNFSVSTGKAKAKKTFNVSAIVAAALVNGQVLEYIGRHFPRASALSSTLTLSKALIIANS